MYLPVEQAKENVRRNRLVAEYIPGQGARCTQCGEWGNPLYKGGYQTLVSGTKRKYFICPACGHKFTADLRESYGQTT